MPQEAAHGQTQTKTPSLCTSSSTATKLSPHEEATPNVRRMARRLGPPRPVCATQPRVGCLREHGSGGSNDHAQ